MSSKKYRNIKNGNTYEVLREDIINCTNANDKQIMVLYKSDKYPDLLFVREINEFKIKFEKID
ncbi:MAG: hypothetical protein ACI37R_05960 [Candidatus Avigastranaerophilus sp.]